MFILKEPEVIRIPRKKYRELEQNASEIRSLVDSESGKIRDIFTEADNIPSPEDFKAHNVEKSLREYLPYMIFYSSSGADGRGQETAQYINHLFSEYLDIIDDEEFERFDSIMPGEWAQMPLEERADRFRDWIYYYNPNEFETFRKDIGYLKFMEAYGYSYPAYKDGKECPQLIRDLNEVWETVQEV